MWPRFWPLWPLVASVGVLFAIQWLRAGQTEDVSLLTFHLKSLSFYLYWCLHFSLYFYTHLTLFNTFATFALWTWVIIWLSDLCPHNHACRCPLMDVWWRCVMTTSWQSVGVCWVLVVLLTIDLLCSECICSTLACSTEWVCCSTRVCCSTE